MMEENCIRVYEAKWDEFKSNAVSNYEYENQIKYELIINNRIIIIPPVIYL